MTHAQALESDNARRAAVLNYAKAAAAQDDGTPEASRRLNIAIFTLERVINESAEREVSREWVRKIAQALAS